METVKKYQTHLSEIDLIGAILRATHKKMMS